MAINYKEFIHPSDKMALTALKALPGFDIIFKKYMSLVGEKMYKIENTSSFLKLGPNQMPEIYNLLVKVCKKLCIPVPDLFLALDREPNAYTSGDTDIFIVVTSGLLETMTLEQIETILAHECGHIICHHTLYHTMARWIMVGAEFFATNLISSSVIATLKCAFAYWERCSELSADRVSAYYHCSHEPVVDVMLSLSGGTTNLKYKVDKDVFLKQAEDYKMLIDNSLYNKALEFIKYGLNDHPLNAYRAYEITEFCKHKGFEEEKKPSLFHKRVTLTVKFDYVSAKNLKKVGEIFDKHDLEIEIGGQKYIVDKNDQITINTLSGKYDLTFKYGKVSENLNLKLSKNDTINVEYNASEKKLTIK